MEYMRMLLVFAALIATLTAQPQLCPANFGDFQDGNQCRTFLRCQNGVAYRFNCPRQFPFFDGANRRCTNQQTINCVQNNNFAGQLLPGQGLGQRQGAGINQVQVAGAGGGLLPGAQPNGFLANPNLSAPNLPPNQPGIVRGRGGNIPVVGGVPIVGVGAGAAANGRGNAGAAANGNALAGGVNGLPGAPGLAGVNVGAAAGVGNQGPVPGNPVVPNRRGVLAPPQPGGIQGNALLNNPLGQGQPQGQLPVQGQGVIGVGAGAAGNNGNGGGLGQGILAGVPLVNVNQRQSATVNQNQSVGIAPGKK